MSETHAWPGPLPRRDIIIENDDPATWTLTSATYDAVGAPADPATGTKSTEGWKVTLDLDEMSVAGFRVVLDAPLTDEEERCAVGEAYWPLLRLPCGILLIGEVVTGLTQLAIDAQGADVFRVSWHDRAAIVPVRPGDYKLRVLQFLNGRMGVGGTKGPAWLFQLTRIPSGEAPRSLPERRYFSIREGVAPSIRENLRTTEAWKKHAMLNPLSIPDACPQPPRMLLPWIEPVTDCRCGRDRMRDYVQPL